MQAGPTSTSDPNGAGGAAPRRRCSRSPARRRRRPRRRLARPGASCAPRSTSAPRRPASRLDSPPRTCVRSPSSCARRARISPRSWPEQAADRAERLGGYLKQSDADRILGDIEDFGRRQPLAVLVGGLALGFIASRLLKASSSNRYQHGERLRRTVVGRLPAPKRTADGPPGPAGAADVAPGAGRAGAAAGHAARRDDRPRGPGPAGTWRGPAVSVPASGPRDGDLREQGIAELLKQLSQETTTLVRQELELAKAEMSVKAKEGGKGAGLLGGAAVAGLLFLGALTATVIGVLDLGMDFWLAALIVTVVWGVIAAVLALQGRKKLQDAALRCPSKPNKA